MASAAFWHFNMRNAQELLNYGLKAQVLITADIFIDFNKMAMKIFKLSMFQCYSLSEYSFDACFFHTKATYQYIKDPEIIRYFKQNAVHGGPAESITRKVAANTERLLNYNPNRPRSHILITEENQQYASKLRNKLAIGSYQFLSQEELENFDLLSDCTGDWNYIVTVQIKYPKHLHPYHTSMPPCPYNRQLRLEDLSEEQQRYFTELNGDVTLPDKKLVMDLIDKTYTCTLEAVQYYLESGLSVSKPSCCLKFRQAEVLKPFVDKLTQMRKQANLDKDEIGSLLFKSILNLLFGKCLSSSENFVKFELCLTSGDMVKLLSRHTFEDFTVLNALEGVCLFRIKRLTALYKFPMIMSIQTLDRAKLSLYKMWDLLRAQFGINNTLLCFYDTDCICAQINDPQNNFFLNLQKLADHFDFSTLPKTHPLYNTENASECGKWKIVTLNAVSVISLRPKAYSIRLKCLYCPRYFDDKCGCNLMKKACGIPQMVTKTQLDHNLYELSMYQEGYRTLKACTVESKNHQLVVNSREYKFHSLNTRRYLLPDMVHTFAFGDYRIDNLKSNLPVPGLEGQPTATALSDAFSKRFYACYGRYPPSQNSFGSSVFKEVLAEQDHSGQSSSTESIENSPD